MNATTVVTSAAKPKLLDSVRNAMRVRHLARSTEKAYVYWTRRFILYHNKRHPLDMGKQEVEAFLNHEESSADEVQDPVSMPSGLDSPVAGRFFYFVRFARDGQLVASSLSRLGAAPAPVVLAIGRSMEFAAYKRRR